MNTNLTPPDGTPVSGEPSATMTTTGDIPVYPPGPPPGYRRTRRIFLTIVIGLTVAVLGAAGTVVALSITGPDSGAREPVLAYFQALSDKDGSTALKRLGDAGNQLGEINDYIDRIAPQPMPSIWTGGGLSEGYRPPENVEVLSTTGGMPPGFRAVPDSEYAIVTVSYSVGGSPGVDTFVVARAPDADWRIVAAGMGSIKLGSDGGYGNYRIGALDDAKSLVAPPGVYRVVMSDDELFTDLTTDVVVVPGTEGLTGAASYAVPDGLELRPEAVDAVESQVRETVDVCATGDSWEMSDTQCPWVPTRDGAGCDPGFGDGSWRVTTYPEVAVEVTADGEATVTTTEPGEAVEDGSTETCALRPTGSVSVDYDGAVFWDSEIPYE